MLALEDDKGRYLRARNEDHLMAFFSASFVTSGI